MKQESVSVVILSDKDCETAEDVEFSHCSENAALSISTDERAAGSPVVLSFE